MISKEYIRTQTHFLCTHTLRTSTIDVFMHVTCIHTHTAHYRTILYFAWEDQSEKVCCIDHKVVINCITVLYEPYSTVMCLIGHIQHYYALN